MKKNILFIIVIAISKLAYSQNLLNIPDTITGENINLKIDTGSVQFFPGNTTNTLGVNGKILGPTIILNRNKNVTLNVNNNLNEQTTIHWHGLHVSSENDGGPHTVIEPNSIWSPSFKVKDWASTYWYHPHLHMKTNEHVQKGVAGFIIVRDSIESQLNLPRTYGIDDIPLVIQSKAFDTNNQIIINSALDSNILINATLNPYINLPAQIVRLRILNGSSERFYNLGLSNNLIFYQIGSDGGLLDSTVSLTRLLIAPGERAEILINLTPLHNQTIQLNNYGNEIPSGIYGALQPGVGAGQTIPNYTLNPLNGKQKGLLTINVVSQTQNAVTNIPNHLIAHTRLTSNSSNITRQLTFSPMNMGPTAIQGPFLINNQHFSMDRIDYEIPLDHVEIWELRNQTPIAHPFHIHDVQFYILDINGNPPAANNSCRKDVIMVPGGNGVVRFITKFEDYSNDTIPFMFHCHI